MGLFGPPNVESVKKMKAWKNVWGLIKALCYQKNCNVRIAAAQALGEIGAPRTVEPLIAALNDNNESVRLAAAEALGKIGDSRAVEPLTTALKDRYHDMRRAAAKALGEIGDPCAVEPLIGALKAGDLNAGDMGVRKHAAEALGKIGDFHAAESLIAALKVGDMEVRKSAAVALDKIGWLPDDSADGVAYWIAKQQMYKLVKYGALAVDPLIAALRHNDWVVRKVAAFTLGKIGDPHALDPLITVLKVNDWQVREAATEALGMIGALAIEPLIAALKTANTQVQKAVSEALDKIGWLPDEGTDGATYWVAKKKWARCIKIGAPSVEPLIAALKDKYSSDMCREVARALGIIGDPRAVEPLIAALVDEFKVVRQIAAEALDKIGWLPDEGIDGATYWVAKNEWDRCVKIGAPAVEPLIAVLTDVDSHVRWAAARALGEIGEPKAVESLAAALNDEDSDVRLAIADALGKLTDPCALVPLISLLKDSNWHIRRTAANALVQLYKYDLLNNEQQNRLLSERPAIIDNHVD